MNCLQYAAYRCLPMVEGDRAAWFGDPNRVIHMQQVIKAARYFDYAVTEFQAAPVLEPDTELDNMAFFEEMMLKSNLGILTGETLTGLGHAVGFRGERSQRFYFDARNPMASRSNFDFKIRALYSLDKIKSK